MYNKKCLICQNYVQQMLNQLYYFTDLQFAAIDYTFGAHNLLEELKQIFNI